MTAFRSRGVFGLVLALVASLATPTLASAEEAQGLPVDQMSMMEIADELVKCVDIDGENYCVHIGFTQLRPGTSDWEDTFTKEWKPGSDDAAGSVQGYLWHVAQMPEKERAELEARELSDAYEAVGKVKLYDHVGLDIPIPDGFFERYPQLGIGEDSAKAQALRDASHPGATLDLSPFVDPSEAELKEEAKQLASDRGFELQALGGGPQIESVPGSPTSRYIIYSAYRKQVRNDFCAPATFQALDGGNDGGFESQYHWDDYVGFYNPNGSYSGYDVSIKNSINWYTTWDNLATPYAVVDTTGKTASWYFDAHQINIGLHGAIVVDHVKLYDEFYTYLATDHGGHFQTGRGYSRNNNTISIFEPLNEVDFLSWGNPTGKVQYVNYVKVFDANQAYSSDMETIIY